jgi:5-methyltetrahydrofolate--homocysteine methyltransferase
MQVEELERRPSMELLETISKELEQGNDKKVLELTKQAIEQKVPPQKILDDGLIAGMNVVGVRFKNHDIFLPEVLLAAKAMYAGMGELKPLLIEEGIPSIGKVVIGSVKGDLHDIGKNLVGIMLKGAGFEVLDLGNDVSPEKFIDTAVQEDASVIGMSALLTTTMSVMKDVVDQVNEKGLSGKIKTIVGGAPVTADFAKDIGADSFGFDGVSAVEEVKRLCNVS